MKLVRALVVGALIAFAAVAIAQPDAPTTTTTTATTATTASSAFELRQLSAAYAEMLAKHPWPTKVLTACFIGLLGGLTAQLAFERRDKLDLFRLVKILTWCVVGSTLGHFYYPAVERKLAHITDWRIKAAALVMIDQFMWDPFVTWPLYFFIMNVIMERRSFAECVQDVRKNYVSNLTNGWRLWLPAQIMNFSLMPVQYRVLFVNLTGFVWTVLLELLETGRNAKTPSKDATRSPPPPKLGRPSPQRLRAVLSAKTESPAPLTPLTPPYDADETSLVAATPSLAGAAPEPTPARRRRTLSPKKLPRAASAPVGAAANGDAVAFWCEHCGKYLLDTKTRDNTEVLLDAMLYWKIEDTLTAAKTVMQLMEAPQGRDNSETSVEEQLRLASRNIDYLRETVLRITTSKLTNAVGRMSVVDAHSLGAGLDAVPPKALLHEHPAAKKGKKVREGSDEQKVHTDAQPLLAAAVEENEPEEVVVEPTAVVAKAPAVDRAKAGYAVLAFLNNQKKGLVVELNADLHHYGVSVSDVAIFDAILPKEIQTQLNRQVKAKIDQVTSLVEAETAQRVAEASVETDRVSSIGQARNRLERATIERQVQEREGEAQALRAIRIAEGNKQAAELETSVELAQRLAIIRAGGEAMRSFNSGNATTATYFMGNPTDALGLMIMSVGQALGMGPAAAARKPA